MTPANAPIRYFLGTNTPEGFKDCSSTLYDSSDGWHTYLLKGGPGTGKSTLLRSIYKRFEDESTEVFCCSADPSSWDAVRFSNQKKVFIDSTAPHIIEPSFWNVTDEVVPLFLATLRKELEKQKDTILSLYNENAALHTQCRKLLKATQGILADNQEIQKKALLTNKLQKTVEQLAHSEWCPLPQVGAQDKRFLSAVTPNGFTVLSSTIQALCPRIFAVEDEHGAVADALLKQLLDRALADGQHCIVCPCPLFPRSSIEHLLLPEVGVAFVTSNRYHQVDYPVFRRLHAFRFLNAESLQDKHNLLLFQAKAASELLQQAAHVMATAKTVHDRLEEIYAAATDWNAVNALADEFFDSLT